MQGIMRSFTSCQATDMDRLFCFSLLLTYLPATGGQMSKSCSSQPEIVIWQKTGQSAVLPCTVTHSAKDLHYEWFVFKESVHFRLKWSDTRLRLEGTSLRIDSPQANDSGIYYCAAVWRGDPESGKQCVGLGTTLVVKERVKVMVRKNLLWLSLALLAIYSLALVTFIIKKHGCNMSVSRKVHKTDKNNSTKKMQFRDVLQEMYSRKNLERGKQTASGSRSQAEAASAEFSSSADDIYQNV